MTMNFNELLSRPVESAKKPPTRPAGTYTATIKSHKLDVSKQQKTPFVRFILTNVQPGEDVIAQNAVDDEGNAIEYSKWEPWKDFYLTHEALYRLREFLESCGISTQGRNFGETIPETKGLPVQFTAIQSPSQKEGSTDIYVNVGDLKGVPA